MEVREEIKGVHPFFGKRTRTHDDLTKVKPISLALNVSLNESSVVPTGSDGLARQARKEDGKPSPTRSEDSLSKTTGIRKEKARERDVEALEIDPNLGRRKRQKSGSPEHDGLRTDEMNPPTPATRHNPELEPVANYEGFPKEHVLADLAPQRPLNLPSSASLSRFPISTCRGKGTDVQTVLACLDNDIAEISSSVLPDRPLNATAAAASDTSAVDSGPPMAKSQKTLRLNTKTGTFGSPPSKKTLALSNGAGTKKKSGKDSTQSQSWLVTIKYGHDRGSHFAIGQTINDALAGAKLNSSLQRLFPCPEASAPKARTSRSTHPFFRGKLAPKVPLLNHTEQSLLMVPTEEKPRRSKSSMTLGEAKSHSPSQKQVQASGKGAFQCLGNTTKIMRFPGAVEACWPPKGMVHVTGPADNICLPRKLPLQSIISTQRKSKYTATDTLAKDDIMRIMATQLDIDNVLRELKCANMDDFAEPERCLRIPIKHFENGLQLQRRVRRELSVKLPINTMFENFSGSEDEIQGDGKNNTRVNTALSKLYKSFPDSLTAFDRSQYETRSWIQKYSPCSAAEVLQCGKEAFIFKAWLQSLTVTAVDVGTAESARSRATSIASRRSGVSNNEKSGKKKRKTHKLEGFVVSSEEENDEMDEISDPEENDEEAFRLAKRTVIRPGGTLKASSRDSPKLKNAVVVSGPSGCGKTAMIYGVAKELGFEIFEINASSKRSGKEILERVGDMTRNHLVHRSDHLDPSNPQDEDVQRISDALSADLKSGRQGTMNSFFKPKKTLDLPAKSTKPKAAKKKNACDEAANPAKAPPKQQKQSLILLEEVDILFEEDKQFWTTVMNLIAQSKRPIVMTCNDERLLPLQTLELHAIIRLSPPPSDVAIDYILLVAAAEGHVVKRKAVKAVYESRQSDLRATLTELDYWCQIGIGDRKGGLDWFYPRWPPGSDIDERGHKIRVVSEGTYETGMGWLGRDHIFERLAEPAVDEQVVREAWDGWNVDIADWNESLGMASVVENFAGGSRASSLSSYEDFVECMSLADICAYNSFATGNQAFLDASTPPVTAKARDDFVIGYELLQADTTLPYSTLSKEVAISIKAQARQLLQAHSQPKSSAPTEAQVTAKIAAFGCRKDLSICRNDFSIAFNPIAEPDKNILQNVSSLEPSIFDSTITTIALDVAPFVRSIVAYDAKLQQERARLSNLLSEGGRGGRRLRNTRSALSALEGGIRKTTRREKYFRAPINPHLIYRTGLQSWQDALAAEIGIAEAIETHSALSGTETSSPGMTDSS